MAFSKPFSSEEKAFIVNNYGKMTNGDIAKSLAKISGEERAAEGVRSFFVDYQREYVTVNLKLDSKLKDRIGDAGLSSVDVCFILESALREKLCPKPKAAKTRAKPAVAA